MRHLLFALLGFAFLIVHSTPLQAACLELKNDNFDAKTNNRVIAVRSFCLSENFGAIFKAPEDVTINKVRVLLSGDGKNTMRNFALDLKIFEDNGTNKPGKVLHTETGLSGSPGQFSGTDPKFLEIKDLSVTVKKGQSFRVTFGHDPYDCSPGPGTPVCAGECKWWSATTDTGPIKAKANIVEGNMYKCQGIQGGRKWRYWQELPESCRPKGNMIIRVLASTTTGEGCVQGGPNGCTAGQTQACTCTDSRSGSQTCGQDGAWGVCQCSGGGSNKCQSGSTQACTCVGGAQGVQSCKADGSWAPCQCKVCAAGSNQACLCQGNKQGLQSCKADGSGWEICQCSGGGGTDKSVCAAGATQVCLCPGNKQGVQSCKSDSSGWKDCACPQDEGGCGCVTDPSGENHQEPWLLALFAGIFCLLRRRRGDRR